MEYLRIFIRDSSRANDSSYLLKESEPLSYSAHVCMLASRINKFVFLGVRAYMHLLVFFQSFLFRISYLRENNDSDTFSPTTNDKFYTRNNKWVT
jgi:hypothetical protein